MQRWKKGLFIGLFSSMLLEQQTVAAAVGLNRPDVKGYKVHEAPRRPEAAVAVATVVPLPDVVATGPLDPSPPMELMTSAQREKLRRLEEEEAKQEELRQQQREEQQLQEQQHQAQNEQQAQNGQQGMVLASRGELPGPAVQNQPEPPQSVKQTGESNAAPKLMQQPGVSGATGNRVITLALRYQGVPYQYGGESPAGFDCSGFIQYVMREAGVEVPRTTYEQIHAGVQVARGDLQPGDLVFFACGGSATSHAGLYIGNGQFIHADLESGISIDDLNGEYWGSVYQAAVRVQ